MLPITCDRSGFAQLLGIKLRMSWAYWAPELLREFRIFFAPTGCPWGAVGLAIVAAWCCGLCIGLAVAAAVLSNHCRRLVVALARTLLVQLQPSAGGTVDLRGRLAEYQRQL